MPTTALRLPAFPDLQEDALQTLFAHTAVRTFPKNTLIINEGERTNSVYLIRSGRVRVFLLDEDGKKVDINVLESGDFFGEMVLDGGPRTASVVTVTPSELSVIPQLVFREFVTKNPDFAMRVILKLILRTRGLLKDVKSLALLDVYGRVARVLIELATTENGKLVIKEKPSVQGIANRIGASREAVSRIIKDLTQRGYIQMEGRRLTIAKTLPPHR
jgi:CRP/FNR family cyclic AMP-dependent transcriptional regulator